MLTFMFGVAMAIGSAAEKQPISIDYSTRSSDDIAACIALKLTESRGYEVRKIAKPKGMDLLLQFRVMGVPAKAATFSIDDLGDQRRLTIFATGKASGAPRMIAASARPCAQN